jgi:hypothetical protein
MAIRKMLSLVPMSAVALSGLLLGACDNPQSAQPVEDDGKIGMGVAVQGLTANQHFCMNWRLYQEPEASGGAWVLIDQRTDLLCAGTGVDSLSDFASCYDGRRFLVEYSLVFFQGQMQVGTAVATSGGGPDDLCAKNTDINSRATVQFQNEGTVGGVNPGIDVDQVCSNDKVELEDGSLVSALWLQPDSCTSGTPDSFCALAVGDGLETVRTGLTTDGLTRYIFNKAPVGSAWDTWYLAFDPGLALDKLYLFNAPWVMHHQATDAQTYGREEMTSTLASWLYSETNGKYVGFAEATTVGGVPKVRVVFDQTAACDSNIVRDAKIQIMDYPACDVGTAEPKGAIDTGDSTFSLVFACGQGNFIAIACDAKSSGNALCVPPSP